MNLANKYRPKSWDDVVEQSVVADMLKTVCSQPIMNLRNFLLIGPAGTGKAQPLTSKVLTPTGFINMGDVQLGQSVITASGNLGYIVGIYPQGKRPIYEITLQDRTKIRVSDEHLNVVYRYNTDRKCREDFCITTKELIDLFDRSYYKLRMDVPAVESFGSTTNLPIDPYLLGILIGDGSLSDNFGFCNSESDIIAKVDSLLRTGWNRRLKKIPGDNYDYRIVFNTDVGYRYIFNYQGIEYSATQLQTQLVSEGYPNFDPETLCHIAKGTATTTLKRYPELVNSIQLTMNENYKCWNEPDIFRTILRDLGICEKSVNKHIPKMYLLADRQSRIRLLQGLFDTDGYTDKQGNTVFTTCSDQLSEDFAFLVRSLGIRDTVVDAPSKYNNNGVIKYTGTTAHNHYLKIPNDLVYCSSEKHLSRRKIRQNPPIRNIVSIKYVGDEECQCIMIDHPDHTYISDDFIPTHNTTMARIMANTINHGQGSTIEIDAASYNSADSAREIVQQAQQYPMDAPYKIFIVDECFPANTLISTSDGTKRIDEIRTNDIVLGMSGNQKVTRVFQNTVLTTRLCCVIMNDRKVITTVDHMFFTNHGWIAARDLQKGDVIYDNQSLQKLWKRIHPETGQRYDVLLRGLWNSVSLENTATRQTIYHTTRNPDLSNLWNIIYSTYNPDTKTQNMLQSMRSSISCKVAYSMDEFRIWDSTSETIIRSYDTQQSNVELYDDIKDDEYSFTEWNFAPTPTDTRWQWEVHNSSDTLVASIRRWLGFGVCNQYQKSKLARTTSTLVLQSRPRFTPTETCSRSRWEIPQREKCIIKGFEETELSNSTWVESVEVYQRGSNDQLFRSSFTDTELSENYVTMYDLEVENDHSYFANGVLVHNCHVLTSQSWQVLLKCLEEGPAKSIFILCTTNPEKIPATIISRVQTFQLSKISLSGITNRLIHVLDSEIAEGQSITYEVDAVGLIAKLSNGGMRDALTLLDKALSYSSDISSKNLLQALNLPNYDDYFAYLSAYAKHDNEALISITDRVYNSGVNFIKWFEGFHSFVMNIIKYIFIQDINATTIPSIYAEKISKYGVNHSIVCLKLSNILLTLIHELKSTQYMQEVALTYMCIMPSKEKKQ